MSRPRTRTPTPTPIESLGDQDAVEGAGESASVAGATLTVDAAVWTNDQPGADSHGVLVSTTVTSSASTWPAGLALTTLYVVRGGEVWTTGISDETRPTRAANKTEGGAHNGPPWSTPDRVDVVVRLDDGRGESVYLAKRGVAIISAQ